MLLQPLLYVIASNSFNEAEASRVCDDSLPQFNLMVSLLPHTYSDPSLQVNLSVRS